MPLHKECGEIGKPNVSKDKQGCHPISPDFIGNFTVWSNAAWILLGLKSKSKRCVGCQGARGNGGKRGGEGGEEGGMGERGDRDGGWAT